MEDQDFEKAVKQMEICCDMLDEFQYDSIQIIATMHEDNNTMLLKAGKGNIFTREGAVKAWLSAQEEMSKNMEF